MGSLNEALDNSGNGTFQQLYFPYGGIRYTNGMAPTFRFYTGQQWDSTSGLSYYVARYYDPIPHQFVSADTVADGLNRYGYAHANPETYADPTGHWSWFVWLACDFIFRCWWYATINTNWWA